MDKDKAIELFEKWCDSMDENCPIFLLDLLDKIKKEQKTQQKSDGLD